VRYDSGMEYRPGRALRTTSAAKFRAIVLWSVWGLAGGYAIRALQLDPILWVVLLAVPFGWTTLIKGRLRSYNTAAQPAQAALKQGNPEIAERGFRQVRERFHWPRFLPRLADYNCAQALLRQGRHAEAIELLERVDRAGGVINVDGAIAGTLSLLHALRGNRELAEEWFGEAEQRSRTYANPGAFPNIMAEVAVALRRSESREIRVRLDNEWAQIEHSLTGERLRPLRILRAFAIAQELRDAAAASSVLAGLGGARAREFAYLGTEWPELQQFIVAKLPA